MDKYLRTSLTYHAIILILITGAVQAHRLLPQKAPDITVKLTERKPEPKPELQATVSVPAPQELAATPILPLEAQKAAPPKEVQQTPSPAMSQEATAAVNTAASRQEQTSEDSGPEARSAPQAAPGVGRAFLTGMASKDIRLTWVEVWPDYLTYARAAGHVFWLYSEKHGGKCYIGRARLDDKLKLRPQLFASCSEEEPTQGLLERVRKDGVFHAEEDRLRRDLKDETLVVYGDPGRAWRDRMGEEIKARLAAKSLSLENVKKVCVQGSLRSGQALFLPVAAVLLTGEKIPL